jgi:hypothetical protein
MSESKQPGRDCKVEFMAEFRLFVNAAFPGLPEDSHQWVSLRRTFLAGAVTLAQLIGRRFESTEEGEQWVAAVYALGAEEARKAVDPRNANPDACD